LHPKGGQRLSIRIVSLTVVLLNLRPNSSDVDKIPGETLWRFSVFDKKKGGNEQLLALSATKGR